MKEPKKKDLTKADLLQLCSELGIDGVSAKMTKDEIKALMKEHEEAPAETEKPKKRSPKKKKEEKDAYTAKTYKEAGPVHFLDNEEVEINPEFNQYDVELALAREDENHILSGQVGGVFDTGEYTRADGVVVKYGTLYVNYGNRKVYIPSFAFFENWNDPKMFPPDNWFRNLQNRIGSVVDFVGMPPVEGDDRYFATRFPAMKKKRRDNWYAKISGTEKYYLDDGTITHARVAEAKEAGLVLEIEGAECFMPAKEIGRYYVNSARKNFRTGQKVFVRISNVERQEVPKNPEKLKRFTFPVKFDASIKDAVQDPQVVHFAEFPRSSTHLATVSKRVIDKKGRVRFYCNVGRDPEVVTIYCRMLPGVTLTPSEGDDVKIRVEGSDPETHKIWGVIIHKEELENGNLQAFAVLDIDVADEE